ncbi:SDR family oxidoreductase [Rhodoferax sp. BAB1]|uniref:SDR family oxidoreductase n=1 Tax=Rhodoferax sp. BAB1 TaxID=2741720 RepID=UPI00157599B7|nr:SDR family oxidoreductase [Rhodoferax sp. BAB1]QKO22625.1 SDR family oxidoreductase [Rhodoferax sp. BAB1]
MKAAQARVLLTGASGGIGQAMVQALLQAGAQVLGVSRTPQPAQAGLTWITADLGNAADLARIAQAADRWGANVVVHAAGLPAFGALPQLEAAQMQAVLQANLLAPMLLTQALLPRLRQLPHAQIVFVGSALGRIGLPGFSLYTASKAGLHGFAEALRRELGDTPVRVQLLAPRSTRTAFNDDAAQAYNTATGTGSDAPAVVAQALLALIESEAAERYLGFPERLAVRLNSLIGPLLDGSFAKHRRQVAIPTPTQGVTP